MPKVRIDPRLSSARSYWQNARKAEKSGDSQRATVLKKIGDQRYAEYVLRRTR